MLFKTSGSTGEPKIIDISDKDMRLSAQSTVDFFNLDSTSVLACALSTDYIAGKMMEFRAQLISARLILEEPSNRPFEKFDFKGIDKIDLLALVPSQVPSFLKNRRLLQLVKNVIIGGAPLNSTLENELLKTGIDCYATFGMTETASHVALRRLGENRYKALPGITFDCDNDSRLIIRGEGRSFGTLLTNDVVELLSADSFIWKGRYDNVVNSGGIKLYPEVLEKKVRGFVNGNFYFTGVPSDKWGSELVMVLEDGGNQADDQSIFALLKEVLSPVEVPKKIIRIPIAEYTSTGKIKRKIP